MSVNTVTNRFYGKYRGQVVNNIDPLALGRLQVKVPSVLGANSLNWALPCVPYAGAGVGMLMIPPIDASIWVEFEAGDINYPIWSGCFWETGQMPLGFGLPQKMFFKSNGITLTLDETPGVGGASLEVKTPAISGMLTLQFNSQGIVLNLNNVATIKLNETGIQLQNGTQSIMLSQANISINQGALEVV